MQSDPPKTQSVEHKVVSKQSTLSYCAKQHNFCKSKPQLQSINRMSMDNDGKTCNYCHEGQAYSCGLVNEQFEPYVYELLMERGWRRCGTYYYKNDLEKSCCKQWTHRMDVGQFKIKKDQKKTVRKMMNLAYQPVVSIVQEKNQRKSKHKCQNKNVQKKESNPNGQNKKYKATEVVKKEYQQKITKLCQNINTSLQKEIQKLVPAGKLISLASLNWNFLDKLKFFVSKPGERADYYCNYGMLLYGCNKKAFDTKTYPLAEFVQSIKESVQRIGTNEDYFIQLQRGGYLVVELSKKLKQSKSCEFQVIQEMVQQQKNKVQNKTQNSKTLKDSKGVQSKDSVPCQKQEQKNKYIQSNTFVKLEPEVQGQLVITTNRINFGKLRVDIVQAQETQQSFQIYSAYCKQIHGKQQKGFSSYTGFLCQKGLTFKTQTRTIKENDGQLLYQPSFDPSQEYQKPLPIQGEVSIRMGCHHMKYYFEDKLIGVGVVDILPHGLSSVYFFYNPEYKDYRLGVFSSILEIQYVRYLSKVFPQFKYYYMGFYIHNNDKMNYKGDYIPYQLLCPITFNFVQITKQLEKKLDAIAQGYQTDVRLAPEGMEKDQDLRFGQDIGVFIDKNIKITYKERRLILKDVNQAFFVPVLTLLKEYISISGKQLFQVITFTF